MSAVVMDPRHLRPSVLRPPMSKSDAQRALVLGDLIGLQATASLGPDPDRPSDVRSLARGLAVLAEPSSGEVPTVIDCGDGGGPFRFLLAQAATRSGRWRFMGSARLGERPRRPLLDALRRTLGGAGLVIDEGSPWPVDVLGTVEEAEMEPSFHIAAADSSQYATSLLFAAAALCRRERRTWTVVLEGPVASAGYLDLTVQWLEAAGFALQRDAGSIAVTGHRPVSALPTIPGDWSSAANLLLIAWRSGGQVVGVDPHVSHPDRAVLRILSDVGLETTAAEDGMRVRGEPRAGLHASAKECPDLLPTLAALACVLPGESMLTDVGILRGKESDRVEAIQALVTAAGAAATLDGERLTIRPPASPPTRIVLESHGDHRRAMASAVLATLCGAILELDDGACVAKSFPSFWRALEQSGAVLEPRAI
jgi:3-phosphoshikimate 1-carboxyvinyltransferase